MIRVRAKVGWRKCQAPRRVDLTQFAARILAGGKAVEGARLRVKHINQTMATARDIVVFVGVLLGEGHEDHAAEGLDVKRRITGRRGRVRKLRQQRQVGAVGVEGSLRKIRGQQYRLPIAAG